jgi:cytochrome c oxidase subunit 2
MNGWVEVMDPTEYQTWLAGGGSESPAAAGEKLFQSVGCATCHKLDMQGRGPNLTGVFGKPQQMADGSTVTVDDAYVRESILTPQAKTVAGFQQIMPTYQGQLSEEQILQLIAYIRSLGGTEQQSGATTGARTPSSSESTTGAVAPDAQRSNPLAPTQPRGTNTSTRTQVNAANANRGGASGRGNSNQ